MASDLQKRWFRQRAAAVHERITAYEVLRRHGISLEQAGDDREEQFSCPFHGEDRKPSARIYPSRDNSPSHAWCFVCQETGWDAIGLWKKFNNLTFGQALYRLERELDLKTPEAPTGEDEPPAADSREAFKKAYRVCEARLLACKPAYRMRNDMTGYLSAGSVLDRTKYRVDTGAWAPEKGVRVLEALRARLVERAAACPVG